MEQQNLFYKMFKKVKLLSKMTLMLLFHSKIINSYAQFATKSLGEKYLSKNILLQFMRGKNHFNAVFAKSILVVRLDWTYTSIQFMKIKESLLVLIAIQVSKPKHT